MKKVLASLFSLIITASLSGQVPQKMSYQAIVRNANHELVKNHAVGMRISILKDSVSGTAVYKEIYNPNPQTNEDGLVTIEIGTGITSDHFEDIDWSSGNFYLKTETDPEGGTEYTITGTSQLLTVPFAYYAKTGGIISYGRSARNNYFIIAAQSGDEGYAKILLGMDGIPAGTYGVYFTCPIGNTSTSESGVNLAWAITKNNETPGLPNAGVASSFIPATGWDANYIFGQSGYQEITLDAPGTIEVKVAYFGKILTGTVYSNGNMVIRAIKL